MPRRTSAEISVVRYIDTPCPYSAKCCSHSFSFASCLFTTSEEKSILNRVISGGCGVHGDSKHRDHKLNINSMTTCTPNNPFSTSWFMQLQLSHNRNLIVSNQFLLYACWILSYVMCKSVLRWCLYQHHKLSVQQLHMIDHLRTDTTHKCNTSNTCLHFFTLTKATDATRAAVNASVVSTDTWHRGSWYVRKKHKLN